MHPTSWRAALVATGVALAHLAGPTGAAADPPPGPVDESLLTPALNQDFAPWTCTARQTGPVCTGHWKGGTDWEPVDLPCGVPLYGRFEVDRRSTRYYDWSYRNYDRFVHQDDLDRLSTSPGGPDVATISARTRFSEPFAVPGDPSTRTIVTEGVPFDLRSANGRSLFRVVGTIVEPPGEEGTFTGHVTEDGLTTRHTDVPYSTLLPEDRFVDLLCEAVDEGR